MLCQVNILLFLCQKDIWDGLSDIMPDGSHNTVLFLNIVIYSCSKVIQDSDLPISQVYLEIGMLSVSKVVSVKYDRTIDEDYRPVITTAKV